jgi:hypothetical protein
VARALAALLAAAGALSLAPAASAACTRWASARGSDGNPGTAARPVRTVHRLLARLPSGGTGCVTGGSTFREHVTIRRPATLQSGGGRARIVGGIVVARGVPHVIVRNLVVVGSGGGRAVIEVRADGARIAGNDVSGTGFVNRNVACILLDGPRAAIVDGNRIHNCTKATRRDLYAPGIAVASALRARITHNLIYHATGDGIALAPNAQRTRVQRNLVDGNVSGIYIGGNRRTASSYNVVTRNIVSNSGRSNVHAAWAGVVGRGNIVTSNCLWNGFGGNFAGDGFAKTGNIFASPRIKDRPRDFTLLGGPCVSMHPRIVPIRAVVLPRFTVRYRLRALRQRVQVMSLTLTGLRPGSAVSVRCASRCSARWSGRAPRSTLALPVLRGSWLARGAVVEVRESRTGTVGHLARIVVVGLPRGVRIEHGEA